MRFRRLLASSQKRQELLTGLCSWAIAAGILVVLAHVFAAAMV